MSTGKAPVGFTGTRNGMSDRQKEHLRKFLENFASEFHHGDCVGADEEAHLIALEVKIPKIVIHPPAQRVLAAGCTFKYGHAESQVVLLSPAPYIVRNHNIVEATQGLVAAPQTMQEQVRSGTWATVRHARKMHKFVHILPR